MKFKRNETRLLNGRERRSQNLKRKSAQLVQNNVLERPTLLFIGPFVDDRRESAAAQVDRLWPMCRKARQRPSSGTFPHLPVLIRHAPTPSQKPGVGGAEKLAWAPVIAIASLEVICVERPGQW